MRQFHHLLKNLLLALASIAMTIIIFCGLIYFYMIYKLPNVDVLKNIQLQVPLRIYTSDGQLIAEYGEKRRIPVSLDQVPKPLINALIATEDKRFYEHPGVDLIGIVRAAIAVATTGRKVQGASTITMQVARDFFLSPEKTYSRKLNEILLALKINGTLSKDKILELYLNKVYLGQRAYGVAAAARVYYGKNLNELTLPQMAMIAGLPQAPSANNPISNPTSAKERRDHVLWRMWQQHYIDQATYEKAIQAPITASYHGAAIQVRAPYVAEMVRDALVQEFGDKAYTLGLKVYTTIQSQMQIEADQAVDDGLIAYSKRHGFRGPIANWGTPSHTDLSSWRQNLGKIPAYGDLQAAAIVSLKPQSATALLSNGNLVNLPWQGMLWARKRINDYLGPVPQTTADILKIGDVVYLEENNQQIWSLSQLPQVEGALVAIDPHDGAIRALVGGFSFDQSHYNRVIQAERQPGSNFKPFIYAAALAKGYTLASMINDAPVVEADAGGENELWRPQNDTLKFYGPTSLRVALTESRNLVSIRLLQQIGIPYAIDYVKRFGFDPSKLPQGLSLALGSAVVTPMQMAVGYSVFANGGYRVYPFFIKTIDNSEGKTIFTAHPPTVCDVTCQQTQSAANTLENPMANEVISPQVAYLMNHVMQDVIKYGTGRAALSLNRSDLAGKTGTTNNQVDAWFSGFNQNLVTSVWVGYDQPKSLHEYGAQAALPIWIQFMRQALKGQPEASMAQPPDIVSVRIDPNTGLLAPPGEKGAIFELFRKQYAPTQTASPAVIKDGNTFDDTDNASAQIF